MVVGGVMSLAAGLVSLTELETLRAELAPELAGLEDDGTALDVLVGVVAGFVVLFGVVSALGWWWMAWKNGQGRAWARITATVLGGFNIVSTASTLVLVALGTAVDTTAFMGQGFGQSAPSLVLQAALLVVSVVALLLLWLAPSRHYVAEVSRWRTWQRWSAAQGVGDQGVR